MQYNINVDFGEPSNRTSLELKHAQKITLPMSSSNRTSLELKQVLILIEPVQVLRFRVQMIF